MFKRSSVLSAAIGFTVGCSSDTGSSDFSSLSSILTGNGVAVTFGTTQDSAGRAYFGGYITNDSSNTNGFYDLNGAAVNGKSSTASADAFLLRVDRTGLQTLVKSLGGSGVDQVRAIATDGADIFVVGEYTNDTANTNSVTDFAGSILLGKSSTLSRDVFVAKLNSSGTQQWIKTMGGSDADNIYSIALTKNGDVYVGGIVYNSTIDANAAKDFDGGALLGRASSASRDAYVARLSGSDGSQTWIRTLGGTGDDRTNKIAVDSNEAVYVPGQFANSSANARSVKDFADANLLGKTSTDSVDGFVAKLNSSGTQEWIKTVGGTSGEDFMDAVAVDSSDNVYVTGSFGNSSANAAAALDFSNTSILGLTSTNSREVLVAKLDTSGTQSWVKTFGGSGSDRAQGLGVDSSGNVYVGGYVNNNSANANAVLDFAGSTFVGKSTGSANTDGFLAKLGSDGTQLVVKALGGNGNDVVEGLSVSTNGYITAAGYSQNNSSNVNSVTDFSGAALPGGSSSTLNGSFMVRWLVE